MNGRRYGRSSLRRDRIEEEKQPISNDKITDYSVVESNIKDLNTRYFDINKMIGGWHEYMRITNKYESKLVNITFCVENNGGNVEINYAGKSYILNNISSTNLKLEKTNLKNEFLITNSNKFNLVKLKIYYVDDLYNYAIIGDIDNKTLWLISRNKITDLNVKKDLENKFKQFSNNEETFISINK